MLITDRLKQQETMSDTEQSIARFFLDHPQEIKRISARKIANELYLSPSTIVRFCQKFGYAGFEAFRDDFVKEMNYLNSHFNQLDSNKPFDEKDSDWHIANNLGHLYKETIDDTLNLIHFEELEKARHILTHHDLIYVHSVGDLIVPAYNFKNKMLRLGKRVEVLDRADSAYITATQLNEQACSILISYSGETNPLLRVAKRLKKQGVPIIVITSFGENALTEFADIALHLSTREKLINNLGNFSSVLSTMYLLDVLYGCVFGNDYQSNYQRKVDAASEYEQYRHSDNPLLND